MNLGNRLLAALSHDDRSRIEPHLEKVELLKGRILFEAGDPIEHVYFPDNGVVSLVISMEQGGAAETATIGREGIIGFVAALGSRRAMGRGIVHVSGSAERLHFERLEEQWDQSPSFRQLLLCYTEALFAQVLQSVACNALHRVEARCCRWILMAHDRAGTPTVPLTHELLAEMLGVQRSTVTLVARQLQAANLISYRRGIVHILDRPGLEEASCECYGMVRQHFERLLPHTYR
jgi:CRP-like cAMP-binding protein